MEPCSFPARSPRCWALILGFGCAAGGACTPRATDALSTPKSGAILGGTADTIHDAVMALLQLQTATTAYACSGTTIAQAGTSAFLLTAAHCVVQHDAMERVVLPPAVAAPSVMTVLPGPDWQASNSQGRKFVGTAISVAPGYDGAPDSPNDLAIVRFTTNMPSLPLIPILEPADDTLGVGSPLTLVGYGVTETEAQNAIRRTVDRPIESLTAQQLSYLQNDMKGQCSGDSGGPALTRAAGAERVAGVMSYGQGIPELNLVCVLESTSVRVSSLASFVHSIVGTVNPLDAGVQPDAANGGDGSVLPDAGPGLDAGLDAKPSPDGAVDTGADAADAAPADARGDTAAADASPAVDAGPDAAGHDAGRDASADADAGGTSRGSSGCGCGVSAGSKSTWRAMWWVLVVWALRLRRRRRL